VYDTEGENVALISKGATASASSCVNGGDNDFPIDGEYRGATEWPNGCHTSGTGPDEWWEVELAIPTKVSKISVLNRIDNFAKTERFNSAAKMSNVANIHAHLNGALIVLQDARRVPLPSGSFKLTGDRRRQWFLVETNRPMGLVKYLRIEHCLKPIHVSSVEGVYEY
jgi:hypothetical protein